MNPGSIRFMLPNAVDLPATKAARYVETLVVGGKAALPLCLLSEAAPPTANSATPNEAGIYLCQARAGAAMPASTAGECLSFPLLYDSRVEPAVVDASALSALS